MDEFVVAGTGHRPPRLGLDYSEHSRGLLRNFAIQSIQSLKTKPSLILSGMANGWDTALAEAAVHLSIPFIAAVPFEGQESRWPAKAQQQYHELLKRAKEVVVVCGGGYANYKFYERDKYLVDNSSLLIALLDNKPEKSGTAATVAYARSLNRQVQNVWPQWEDFIGAERGN